MRIKRPVLEGIVQNLTMFTQLLLDTVDMCAIVDTSFMNLSSSLITLSLHYCGLQGNLSDGIFHLPNLKLLILRENFNLAGNFLKVNWSSPLEYLDVSDPSLSGNLPDSISNLKLLRYFGISQCSFIGSIPASFANLTKLSHLELSQQY